VLAWIWGGRPRRHIRRHAAIVSLIADRGIHQCSVRPTMADAVIGGWRANDVEGLVLDVNCDDANSKILDKLRETLPRDLLNLLHLFQHDMTEDRGSSGHQNSATPVRTHFDMRVVHLGDLNSWSVALLVQIGSQWPGCKA
jgi:hypothetical protein